MIALINLIAVLTEKIDNEILKSFYYQYFSENEPLQNTTYKANLTMH